VARRISESEVVADPNAMRLLGVSAAALGEGASPGEATSRLAGVVRDAADARRRTPPIRVVLFVRFLADLAEYPDAVEELRSALSQGALRLVGNTDAQGLKRLQQQAKRLLPHLHLMHVAEPTPKRAVKMVFANLQRHNTQHGVEIADTVVNKAVELAVTRKLGRLPHAAINIIDHAASALRLKVAGTMKTSAPTPSTPPRVDEAFVSSVVAEADETSG